MAIPSWLGLSRQTQNRMQRSLKRSRRRVRSGGRVVSDTPAPTAPNPLPLPCTGAHSTAWASGLLGSTPSEPVGYPTSTPAHGAHGSRVDQISIAPSGCMRETSCLDVSTSRTNSRIWVWNASVATALPRTVCGWRARAKGNLLKRQDRRSDFVFPNDCSCSVRPTANSAFRKGPATQQSTSTSRTGNVDGGQHPQDKMAGCEEDKL